MKYAAVVSDRSTWPSARIRADATFVGHAEGTGSHAVLRSAKRESIAALAAPVGRDQPEPDRQHRTALY